MKELFLNIKFWTVIVLVSGLFSWLFYLLDYRTIYSSDTALLFAFGPSVIMTIVILKTTKILSKDKFTKLTTARQLILARVVLALGHYIILTFFSNAIFNTIILATNNYIPTNNNITESTYQIVSKGQYPKSGRRSIMKYSYAEIRHEQKLIKIHFPYNFYDSLETQNYITLTLQNGALGYDKIINRKTHN